MPTAQRTSPSRRRLELVIAILLVSFSTILSCSCNSTRPVGTTIDHRSYPMQTDSSLSADELAGLAWLDYVTGPLPKDEEKEWWDIGGSQRGTHAKRYHIAFCGYAAASIGIRANSAELVTVGRILGNCITRYLQTEVWEYSMDKEKYWGSKPWAPDPCYRENVMYSGHLLQLLAFYERFTGDTKYWTSGWDFKWKDGRIVHYTVSKLIDVTVIQMRESKCGGIACEPGFVFFPCNNHSNYALALFAKMGYGDWSKDSRRWEKWALKHYTGPLFGGGALSFTYHEKSTIMLPKGDPGLDGWSLLWYEPWATDRKTALSLWKKSAGKLNWDDLENTESKELTNECLNPAPVPIVASVSFLAAAARACDDTGCAMRLEAICDRSLVRKNKMLYLDTLREWRIGATANRIISFAEENGSSFRDLLTPTALERNKTNDNATNHSAGFMLPAITDSKHQSKCGDRQ